MCLDYTQIIKDLVPMTIRLASIYGSEGITASNVRFHGLRLKIIHETTPLHFLSSVMKQAGLQNTGTTRCSTNKASKGRRQYVYVSPSPYTD